MHPRPAERAVPRECKGETAGSSRLPLDPGAVTPVQVDAHLGAPTGLSRVLGFAGVG